MKTNKIVARTDTLVLGLLIIDSVYRVASVFYTLPLWPSTTLLLITGILAGIATCCMLMKERWVGTIPKPIFLLACLVLSIFLSLFLQFLFFPEIFDFRGESSQKFPRLVFIMGLIWMVCGSAVQRIEKKESLAVASIMLVFLGAAVFSNLQGSLIISYSALSETRADGMDLSHLVIGEAAAFMLILAFAFAPFKWRAVVFLAGIAILFSLGGRTALFTYGLAIFFYLILKKSAFRFLPYILVAALPVAIIGFNYMSLDLNDSSLARMLLIDGIGTDDSLVARESFFEGGLTELSSQVLMGDPAFLIRRFGSIGTYIHNLLSAWQFFGFFPFLLFLTATFWIGCYIWKRRKILNGPIDDFGIVSFLHASISILTGKSIVYYSFWFIIGFWLFRMSSNLPRTSRDKNKNLPIRHYEPQQS